MLQLFDYFRSSACFRVRIALNLKGLTYETIPIHLVNNGGEHHAQAYQNINPQQLVPALKHEEKIITQSLAIIEYLEELYPTPALLPGNSYQKSVIRAFALAIAADIHPLDNMRVLHYLTNELKITENEKNTWYQHWIIKGFDALEITLSQSKQSNFCFGDIPTLADVCLVPQMYNARRFSCDLTHYPNLVRVDAHCQKNPAFQSAFPKDAQTV